MIKNKKILMTSSQGCGKSTLVNLFLKDNLKYNRPPNFSRVMKSKLPLFKLNEDTNFLSQCGITGFMAYQILENDNIIFDRSLIDTFAYANESKHISDKELQEIISVYGDILKDDNIIHFYLPIEFPLLEDDEMRSKDEEYRTKIDKYIKNYLDENNIEYYELRGNVEKRYNKMKNILKSFIPNNIQTSHEVPVSLLEKSKQFNDYDYSLLHLMDIPEYKEFYKENALFREQYLDNSAFEYQFMDEDFDIEKFHEIINYIKPSHIIIPDVLDNSIETIRNFKDFNYNILPENTKIIGVCQGKNYKELKNCYDEFVDKCDVIAIPFHSEAYQLAFPPYDGYNKAEADMNGRIEFIKYLTRVEDLKPNSLHLIGMSLPEELTRYSENELQYIKSIDTASPYQTMKTIGNYPLDITKVKVKPNYVMMKEKVIGDKLNDEELEIFLENVKDFKNKFKIQFKIQN